MIKYFCDICEEEIENPIPKLGVLDFTKQLINLCDNCKPKFNGAKESIYSEYSTRYEEFREDYLNDLKEIILAEEPENVDPAPVFDD